MRLLGLELCDAGILVAGGDPPRLLRIDEDSLESPGFALPDKKNLIIGKAAEQRARLFPRQIMSRFWESLTTDPLDPPLPAAGNQAEVACAHLAQVWEKSRRFGNALVIAVPANFQRTPLGLLLGMSQELEIPVQGFVRLPLAAVTPGPEDLHIHVDAHLHHFEVSILRAAGSLELQDALTVNENGLEVLYKLWVQTAAAEFLRMTRFDPFHSAETEQELYRRLPPLLAELQNEQAAILAIQAGPSSYSVRLTRGMLLETAKPVYEEVLAAVRDAGRRGGASGTTVSVQISHRVARLPGILECLRQIPNTRVAALPAGAAALALPALWRELTGGRPPSSGVALFRTRPWSAASHSLAAPPAAATRSVTHLLYRNLAYPLTDQPLRIGRHPPVNGPSLRIEADDAAAVDSEHCSVFLQSGQAVLTDLSSAGIFLNHRRIEGSATLSVGDAIRLGASPETILAIACLERHET